MLENCGFQNVETYIQSGNVFLESEDENANSVGFTIKQEIVKQFGYDVPVIVLSKADLEKCISDFKVTVERYVGDVDNRVHARFFAINRLMKIIKRKFNKPTYVAQSIC